MARCVCVRNTCSAGTALLVGALGQPSRHSGLVRRAATRVARYRGRWYKRETRSARALHAGTAGPSRSLRAGKGVRKHALVRWRPSQMHTDAIRNEAPHLPQRHDEGVPQAALVLYLPLHVHQIVADLRAAISAQILLPLYARTRMTRQGAAQAQSRPGERGNPLGATPWRSKAARAGRAQIRRAAAA